MVYLNEENYGLLYSAEPEYLRQMHEDATAHWVESEGLDIPVPKPWNEFATELKAYFKKP